MKRGPTIGRDRASDDLAAIHAIRAAVGDDMELMADFNQGLHLGEALLRCHMIDDEGLAWIEEGIEDWGATGAIIAVPYYLTLKAEALYLAQRPSEALEGIKEAEGLAERFEERWCCAELNRLRGVFLAAVGANETQIEASFREAIRTAKEQKSVSLEKRAEATYAEYRRQKASGSDGRKFRLPL